MTVGVQTMILRQAATLTITGAATGLGVAIAGRPLIANTAQVRMDPLLVALTVGVLILVVLAAAWFPSRRAARIEPTLALKRR